MLTIVRILLLVLALDAFIAAWFFDVVWLSPVGVMLLIVGFYGWFRKKSLPRVEGWSIGSVLDISNPNVERVIKDVKIPTKALDLGMLVLGSPGGGKSESINIGYLSVLCKDIAPSGGWAEFEGKGDLDIYKKTVAAGAKPDYFFSSELPGSHSINLFNGNAADLIDRLNHSLIGHTSSTSYYEDAQKAVLYKVVPLLKSVGVATNLRDLYTVLTIDDAALEVLHMAKQAGANEIVYENARRYFKIPINDRLPVISGLLNRLFVFVSGPGSDRLNAYQPDIDIGELVQKNKRVYFHLPYTDYSRSVAIAIVEMFAVEARRRQLNEYTGYTRFPLIFDDWGKFFYEGFEPFAARCRSAKMPLIFAFQSKSQLDDVSVNFANSLDDHIATKIIMRINGEDTAQFACRLLGHFETTDLGVSQLGNRDGTSLHMRQQNRIEPINLKELSEGEAFVSTLIKTQETTRNALWKVRFPLADMEGWQSVNMPSPDVTVCGEGLNLWQRYLNPSHMAELHVALNASVDTAEEVLL